MAARDRSAEPTWRRLLGWRTTWSVACTAVALPYFLDGRGIDLVPFMLALVAGWLFAMSFVDATARAARQWHGVVVHVVGAVTAGALLFWSIRVGADTLDTLSEPARGAVLLLQVGGLTGVCWMWIGLLARGLAALPGRSDD